MLRKYKKTRSWFYRLYRHTSFWGVRALQVALSPIVLMRIDTMFAGKIGHVISETEQVLGQLSLSQNRLPRRIKNFIIIPKSSCNKFLVEKYIELFQRMPNTTVISIKFS